MVERHAIGWSVSEVAAAAGVTPKTARKWRDRFAARRQLGPQRRHRGSLCGPGKRTGQSHGDATADKVSRRSGARFAGRCVPVPVGQNGARLQVSPA